MPFCRECGKEVEADWKNCPFCSHRLSSTESNGHVQHSLHNAQVLQSEMNLVNDPIKSPNSLIIKLIIFSFILYLFGLLGASVYVLFLIVTNARTSSNQQEKITIMEKKIRIIEGREEKSSSSFDDAIHCPDCENKLMVPYDCRPVHARCSVCKCVFIALHGSK